MSHAPISGVEVREIRRLLGALGGVADDRQNAISPASTITQRSHDRVTPARVMPMPARVAAITVATTSSQRRAPLARLPGSARLRWAASRAAIAIT
jgi:hypothetical protein